MTNSSNKYKVPFLMMVVLFFLFGFLTVLNGQLQSPIKVVFNLTNFQTSLLTFSFFSAFVLTGPLASKLIDRKGNKTTLVVALLVLAVALSIFLAAAYINSFEVFVGGSFILGAGITMLQVVANPYLAALGSPETAGTRINLAGAFNSLAGTIAPLFAANVIFGGNTPSVEDVKMPYIGLTIFALVLALVFFLLKLPEIKAAGDDSKEGEETKKLKGNAWQFSHLTLGVIAIFAYVGAEVAIGNNIKTYIDTPAAEALKETQSSVHKWAYSPKQLEEKEATSVLDSLLGKIVTTDTTASQKADSASAMTEILKMKKETGASASIPKPIEYFMSQKKEVNAIGKASGIIASLYWGSIMIGRFIGSFGFKNANGKKGLILVSSLAMVLALLGTFFPGDMSFTSINLGFTDFNLYGNGGVYSLILVGLAHSVMWGYIFGLAIDKLGIYTNQASGYLLMGVFGGAVIPTIQSYLADSTGNWQITFILVAVCEAYLLYYALIGSKVKKSAV